MNISTFVKKCCGIALLTFFCATTLSAAELPGNLVGDDAASLHTETGKPSSSESLAGSTIAYFKGYAANYKSEVKAPTLRDLSEGAVANCLNTYCKDKEIVTVPLYTPSKENSWGLASLQDGFSLNLQNAIRNLGVILQHRF